jgi:hypothetical protein
MEIIVHRINTIDELNTIDRNYGTEIDIRSLGSNLILNHDPYANGELLTDYLDEYKHGTLILNIKEAGLEDKVLSLVKERPYIKSFFLLDIEFPFIYNASKIGEKKMAIRYSEFESIETVSNLINKVEWVWIDTFNKLPILEPEKHVLNKFKKCLVCPERWDREIDIQNYKNELKNINFSIDAVMTSKSCINHWLSS